MISLILSLLSISAFIGAVVYFGGENSKAAQRKKEIEEANMKKEASKASNLPPTKPGDIKVTEDGKVTKDIITEGTGEQPKVGDRVKVHYTGTLSDGKKFDSSLDRNEPFVFTIGQGVIEGWSKGVATMKVGEKSRFVIDPDYGYGSQGAGENIPGGATLIFEIELLEILK